MIQTPPPMKGMANADQFHFVEARSLQEPHHQLPESADISAWASVAFTMLILFLPALTAANTSSHTTLSCIALCLYIFLQLSLQASGLQQNSFCGSSSHRNCCQALVALRGQPAQETGKWRVGCEPCLLPFTAWPQPVASTFLGSEQMEEQPNLSLLSSPLPNRVQAMEATGREQSCQITGLGKPNAIFLFPVLPEHQSTLGMVLLSHLATALGWLCDQRGQV